jgi:tetratricopeptide (TPR) repeat protein
MKAQIYLSSGSAVTTASTRKSLSNRSLLWGCLLRLLVFVAVTSPGLLAAQNNHAIWGEVKIKVPASDSGAAPGATIALNKVGTGELARQTISSGGRYRFTNLSEGDYDIVVEVDGRELTRVRLNILRGALSPFYGFRQDFEFEWKPNASPAKPKNEIISAAEAYNRSAANQSVFNKAQRAVEKKKYDEAVTFLTAILSNDKEDFQVWALLGTVYFVQEKPADAEKAYLSSLELKPTFMALFNLGRLRSTLKRFDEAIDPLTRALASHPESGQINLLLGEAYLQTKKGSKAIPYLNEAARLGQPEAHLRLGWLYNAAGMKDKAVVEYQEFLKKRPDYPDRKKLEQYISAK